MGAEIHLKYPQEVNVTRRVEREVNYESAAEQQHQKSEEVKDHTQSKGEEERGRDKRAKSEAKSKGEKKDRGVGD